ncbi:MAG: ABC transporter substrate-binding protein [Peptococcaceae bacterium]|jgi:ABC-type nitrate/sulfonate/bicarbonate transport system substrate-binding protein|nr:ABC transporter substrate-binding protein [Peptococcaceae bacterium]
MKKMKKQVYQTISFLFILALLTAAATSCSGTNAAPSTSAGATQPGATSGSAAPADAPKELFPLKAVTPPAGYGELLIADALNFFEEEGIDIVYIGTLGQGITDLQMIEQGECDVSYNGHPASVAQARLQGFKITMVAPGMVDDPDNPHVTYLVDKDSDLYAIDDLVGKKVGVTGTAACIDGYIKYYLNNKGLDSSSIEFVTLPQTWQMEQAVLQGLIDATTSHSTTASIAKTTDDYRVIGSSWTIFESPAAGLGARCLADRIIEEHPEVVQGFVNAMYRARLWINGHLEEAREIGAAYAGLEPEDLVGNVECPEKNIDNDWIKLWFDISEDIGLWEPGDILTTDIYTNQFIPRDAPESDKTLKWDGSIKDTSGENEKK